jgi:hypothetical protein
MLKLGSGEDVSRSGGWMQGVDDVGDLLERGARRRWGRILGKQKL